MERIVSVVEQTGGSIIGFQGLRSEIQTAPRQLEAELPNYSGAEAIVERQPMMMIPPTNNGVTGVDYQIDSVKKKKIMVNLD